MVSHPHVRPRVDSGTLAPARAGVDHVLEVPRAALGFVRRQLRLRRRERLLLLLVIFAGLLLRVQGIQRHPAMKFESLYVDEPKIIDNTLNVMRGRNILEHYPLALYYWLEPQFRLAKLVTFWLEDVPEGRWLARDRDFVALVRANPLPYYVLARANMTFFGLGLVLLLFMIARELAGVGPALAVAALAAAMPLFVIYSKMAYYDLPMTFWYVVTLCVLCWTWKHRSVSGLYWSAALLAWTFCSKQNAVTLLPIGLVVMMRVAADASGGRFWAGLRSRHFWLALLLGALVLVWAYPALLDREALSRFVELLRTRYYNVETDTRAPSYKGWIGSYWVRYAHMSTLVMLVTGVPLLIWLTKARTLAWFFAAALIIYLAVAGNSKHSLDRTMLPLIPALLLGVAGWLLLIERHIDRRSLKWTAGTLLVVPALVAMTYHALRYNFLITSPETRELAARWLLANAPDSRVAKEQYGPLLPKKLPWKGATRAGFAVQSYQRLSDVSLRRLRPNKLDYLVLSLAYKQAKRYDMASPYKPAKRYRKLRSAFPEVAAFYPRLPPSNLLSAHGGQYLEPTWGAFFDWGLVEAWRQQDSYTLGPPVLIVRGGDAAAIGGAVAPTIDRAR
jgi:hypothetical protein